MNSITTIQKRRVLLFTHRNTIYIRGGTMSKYTSSVEKLLCSRNGNQSDNSNTVREVGVTKLQKKPLMLLWSLFTISLKFHHHHLKHQYFQVAIVELHYQNSNIHWEAHHSIKLYNGSTADLTWAVLLQMFGPLTLQPSVEIGCTGQRFPMSSKRVGHGDYNWLA